VSFGQTRAGSARAIRLAQIAQDLVDAKAETICDIQSMSVPAGRRPISNQAKAR
jgi:hypothetical protein